MVPAIVATDLFKGFGAGQRQTTVLRGVSVQVKRGETVFLVGPSGSGKTTLLSILGCILTPDAGEVRVLDQNVMGMNADERAAFRRERLGFIFQNFNLFPTLSALDNIRLSLTMRGARLADATDKAANLLNQVGLFHRSHLRPPQLSTGECQRVAVARALADNPSLLFADEPTAALDAENGKSVLKLLTRLVKYRCVTLVVVTHDSRIYDFADRIIRIEDGRLTNEWKRDTGVRKGQVESAKTGRAHCKAASRLFDEAAGNVEDLPNFQPVEVT
jgi:putative ABC transport system ATP-binding protein